MKLEDSFGSKTTRTFAEHDRRIEALEQQEARIDVLEEHNRVQQQLIEELLTQNTVLNEALQLLYSKLK